MNLRTFANELPFFLLLLSIRCIHAKDPEEPKNQQVKPVHEFLEESSSEDQFSSSSSTTTESSTTVETYRKLSLSITGKQNSSTAQFKPSVHLGEIKESRISTNPFNNVQHIKFENGLDSERPKDFRLVYQQPGRSLHTDQRDDSHRNFEFEIVPGSLEESKKAAIEQNDYVKFQDDVSDVPRYQYDAALNDHGLRQQLVHAATENPGTKFDFVEQQVFQNPEKPVYDQETSAYLGRPTNFQSEAQNGHGGSFWSVDSLKTPQYVGFYDHRGHQAGLQEPDLLRKPNNGVVYIQESSFLRTRKFPYPMYQPTVGYHQVEFVNEEHPNYSIRQRISPWKKILHLVGAFLPLGLLVAALTPKVVKVNNTTEPSITLSKWRANDLPLEHKLARFTQAKNVCEERSICDMILAGEDTGSTALQNILWNLATRTSTTVAKESGLQAIFEAVKKKDCTSIVC